jgi:hypothetical protein
MDIPNGRVAHGDVAMDTALSLNCEAQLMPDLVKGTLCFVSIYIAPKIPQTGYYFIF